MNDDICISLPSLIHRLGRSKVIKAQSIAKLHQCELKRVRRSRHWQLLGEALKVHAFCGQLKAAQLPEQDQVQYHYLIKKIETALLTHADKLEPLSAKLERLINQNPNITLAELIHLSDCTLAQARMARFNADNW
ncbi:ribosome recycling factor family protein [Shewanella youngdeokensis]|uniref:Ribosome recycling factor family protein n=1 Tax=Shewanella youngdeokensis TaxID=2999068 RepID=A0ABZ0JY38_9GAMM|nr:ribosome recycling factor family protein [Shewanella sp. DAU334]